MSKYAKYIIKLPQPLKYLTNHLYMGSTLLTARDRRVIACIRRDILQSYKKKIHYQKELLCLVKPYCRYVLDGKLYSFIREDDYKNNGFINLYCCQIDKVISVRVYKNTFSFNDTQLDRKIKISHKIIMNRILYER